MRENMFKGVKGASPAVSAVIITAIVVSLVLVAMTFANNFLESRISESEFDSIKQFMQNTAVQIDDLAWIPGTVQTGRYSSRYGEMEFIPNALNYTIYYRNASGEYLLCYGVSGILAFKMPISRYSISDNYFELVYPTNNSLVFEGATAPIARVYIIERAVAGNYIRIILNPCIRLVESNFGGEKHYRLYLPTLYSEESPKQHKTATFKSTQLINYRIGQNLGVTKIRIVVTPLIYDAEFFGFSPSEMEKTINIDSGSVVEAYISRVGVSIGLHA